MIEKFIDTLDRNAIYKFMRKEYNKVTNNGDIYDVEKHDKLVADKASKHFAITPQEAGELYVDFEMKIAEFQIGKLIEEKIIELLRKKVQQVLVKSETDFKIIMVLRF